MNWYFFDHALLPDGWACNVMLGVGDDGAIKVVQPDHGRDRAHGERFAIGLPGIVNAHSHAFQRAMAGLAEFRGAERDTFWSWRETMYRYALALTPDDQRAVAAHLYVELLKRGYTSVVEFHYLHNQPDGRLYDDPAIMSLATVAAAVEAGIGLTHIPVLYMTAGFDRAPLTPRQRRFGLNVETLIHITGSVRHATAARPDMAVGLSAHSLRAVPPDALADLLAARRDLGPSSFHIHVAEQIQEVDECRHFLGLPPVAWLLDHAPVDHDWTLVHGTHATPEECGRLGPSGATVALCPTTEGNLGDGIFPLRAFLDAAGMIAIGSDSHVCVDPWEEMRWLEYVQRLSRQERNILPATHLPSTATALYKMLGRSAAQVTGRRVGQIAAGYRADIIVIDNSSPQYQGRAVEKYLDTAVFACNDNPVRHVMVGGRWQVRDGRHAQENEIANGYRAAQQRLAQRFYA